MSWPLSQDYNEAVQSPQTSFSDADLQRGRAAGNALGIPLPRSGNFADVYEMCCPGGQRWAVKCFTREVAGLRERYQEVSRHLQRAALPFTVDFTFLDRGIRVGGRWYPVLKMQWVEGLTLNEFVRQYVDKPDKLEALLQIWVRMSGRLRSAGIAHGDLQHGNLLLVPSTTANALAAKLIDYDGTCVPALAGRPSGEVGHPCYQHPQRLRERVYGREVDRFPFLLIATSLCCLQVGGRALWEKYDSGDNLLFREADLQAPVKSPLFYELLKLGDPRCRSLVERAIEALRTDLSRVPLLEELPELPAPTAITPSAKPAAATATLARTAPVSTPRGERRPIVHRPPRMRSRGRIAAVLVAGFAILALVGGSLLWSMHLRSLLHTDDEPAPKVARNDATPPAPQRLAEEQEPSLPRQLPKKEQPVRSTEIKPPALPDQPRENVLGLASEPPRPRELYTCKLRHQNAVRALSISANGQRALSLGEEGDLHLWNLSDGNWLGGKQAPKGDAFRCAALLPDGKRAVAGSKEKLVYLMDLERNVPLAIFEGHAAAVVRIAVSPNGKQVLSGGEDGAMHRWDVAAGAEIDKWKGHEKAIQHIQFSPDGQRVLTASQDGAIRLWDARTGKEVFSWPPSVPPPSAVTLAKTDRIVLGLRDGSIRMLAPGRKKPLLEIPGRGSAIRALSFTPDGHYLALINGDKSLSASLGYDHSGKLRLVPVLHEETVPRALAFTPDGRRIVLGCADGTVRVCEVQGSASSSHEEMPESPPPPVKRGDPLKPQPPGPVVQKPPDSPPPSKPGTPRPGDVIQNSLGMKLTYVPAGKFRMGTSDDDLALYQTLPNRGYDPAGQQALRDEMPKHEVRISKGFYLGVYEVTQREFEKVMGKNPSEFKGAKLPVDTVTWTEAVAFCKKLSELPEEKKAGRSYRLPTEAEWEYACRAGTTTAFHYGESLSFADANFDSEKPFGDGTILKRKRINQTVEVGRYKANAWGLYDMHGNVWEWCLDGPRTYAATAVVDPQGPEGDSRRVLRGGSWRDGAVRSAFRKIRDHANYRINICGLRVLCEQKMP